MLFRSEVLQARKARLTGDVLIAQPMSYAVIGGVITTLIGAAVLGLSLGNYARTETAQGYLVPTEGLVQSFPPRPGVIAEVLVSEGQTVTAGQPLVRIRTAQADASGGSVEDRQLSLIDDQLALYHDRIDHADRAAQDRLNRLQAEQAGLKAEIAQAKQQLAAQQAIAREYQTALDGLEELRAKGYASDAQASERKQAVLSQTAQITVTEQSLASLQARLAQSELQEAAVPADTAEAIRELKSTLADLQQRRADLVGRRDYMLTAPIDGRVTALQAHVGRRADTTKPLLTVLPDDAVLEAELFVPSRAAGFVQPGQSVRVLYDAFPYQRFGAYPGQIAQVSQTIFSPQDVAAPIRLQEPVYRVTVALSDQHIDAYGQPVSLQAGMTLSANIVLEKRSLLDWLLEPVRAVRARS